MLTLEQITTAMRTAQSAKYRLTFVTTKKDGTIRNNYTELPCYGSVPYYLKNSEYTFFGDENLAVFPLNVNKSRVLLFAEDSPFTEILDLVYEFTYKDAFTKEQFIGFVVNKGLILESQQIKDWCMASFMGLAMAVRDITLTQHKSFYGKTTKDTYHNPSFFAKIPDEIEYKKDHKLKTIYESAPEDRTFSPYYKDFLTVPFHKKTDYEWTSGTDAAQYAVTGFRTLGDSPINTFFSKKRSLWDKMFMSNRPKYEKDYKLLDKDVLESDGYKSLVEELRKAV